MQMKDQIGTYSYFPSTLMHRAAGGYGGFNIAARPVIFVPYLKPVEEFTVLVSDWWNVDHKVNRWNDYISNYFITTLVFRFPF